MSEVLQIRLKRSVIGRIQKHRVIVNTLGLRKINQVVRLKDTPQVRGMIGKVSYLLDVEGLSPKPAKKEKSPDKQQSISAVKKEKEVEGTSDDTEKGHTE